MTDRSVASSLIPPRALLMWTCAIVIASHSVLAPAQGQTCRPAGTPVTLSDNGHYFRPGSWYTYPQPTPLIGMSYEYLCHVNLGNAKDKVTNKLLSTEYCNLTNYQTIFSSLQTNLNHIVRVNATFNSSPGVQLGNSNSNGKTVPLADEQVYPWFYINQSAGTYYWDLSQIDQVFLTNLKAVVCSAYQNSLVVEVTLFDPWNPAWASSPFNPSNAKAGQGFTGSATGQYFADMSTDTPTNQNGTTRAYQEAGVKAIVTALKAYPNIIWEVANEPDQAASSGAPIANVMAWQEAVIGWIQASDSNPPHLIMVNGDTSASFAWNVKGAEIEAAHYTQMHKSYDGYPFSGAIDIEMSLWNQSLTLAFPENRSLPDYATTVRDVADVRAEAWEFVVGGGGLFNGYSYNMTPGVSTEDPTQVSAQLYYLQNQLAFYCSSPGSCGASVFEQADLDTAVPSACGTGSWCSGVLGWGALESNASAACRGTANVYWGAMMNAGGGFFLLYVHHGTTLHALYGGYPADGFHELPCGTGIGASGFFTPLEITVPTTGCYAEQWIDPQSGVVIAENVFLHLAAGTPVPVASMPYYKDDVLFLLTIAPHGSC